jgi:hypothetical protein
MEVNHVDEVLNIAVPFCSALYLLNFEIYAFGISISNNILEVSLYAIPMVMQHIYEVSDRLEITVPCFLDPIIEWNSASVVNTQI